MYKNNSLLGKRVNIYPIGAEKLNEIKDFGNFDSLLSINVIEHAWDAFEFLENIHKALKHGGMLIFHERFYRFDLKIFIIQLDSKKSFLIIF